MSTMMMVVGALERRATGERLLSHHNQLILSSMSTFVQPTVTAVFPPAQPDDPNSPVLFKDNISLVQAQITTVRSLAHEALNAMYVSFPYPYKHLLSPSETFLTSKGAYQPGSSPAHTAGTFYSSSPIYTNIRW